MSQYVGKLKNPKTNEEVEIYQGFSWPCLFFGVLWFLAKGMLLWAAISFIIVLVTGGIAWLFLPFFSNNLHYQAAIKGGFTEVIEGDDQMFDDTKDLNIQAVNESLGNCPFCDSDIHGGVKYCPKCGKSLEPIKCSNCNSSNPITNEFCQNCGNQLNN